jgi:hypothetical protein
MDKLDKIDALIVLILLLPGFLGVLLYGAISEVEKQENLDKIILALTLTLASNLIYGFAVGTASFVGPLLSSAERDKALRAFAANLGWTTLIAGFLGIFWATIQNNGLLFKAAIWCRMTRRTGAIDVWHQTFARSGRSWLRVRFKCGIQLVGWARYYSEDSDKMQLFLSDATWYFPPEPKEFGKPSANTKPMEGSSLIDSETKHDLDDRGKDSTEHNIAFQVIDVKGPGVLITNFEDVRAIDLET